MFFGNFLIIFENRKWAQPPKGGAGWNFIDFPPKIDFLKILKNRKTSKNPVKYVFLGFTFVVSYVFTKRDAVYSAHACACNFTSIPQDP